MKTPAPEHIICDECADQLWEVYEVVGFGPVRLGRLLERTKRLNDHFTAGGQAKVVKKEIGSRNGFTFAQHFFDLT